MNMNASFPKLRLAFWGLLLLPALGWANAAKVDFVVGSAVAVTPAGVERKLAKGGEVQTGEVVRTGADGRIQLRFSDGAMLSLQPQSDFRLDNYQFSGKEDGRERGFFSLLKGGFRTITGLIGRSNRDNYQTRTAVATIGIRGTEYLLSYLDSDRIAVSTGEGAVEVCVGADCVVLAAGESAIAEKAGGVRRVATRPRLQPAQPNISVMPVFASSDCHSSGGLVCAALSSGPGQTVLSTRDSSANTSVAADFPVNAVFSEAGVLQSFTRASGQVVTATQIAESATDGPIGWGRWLTAVGSTGTIYSNQSYIAGRETPVLANIVAATYALIGASTPVSDTGVLGGTPTGSLNVSVSGGITSVALSMTVPHSSTNHTFSGNASITSTQFSMSVSGSISGEARGAFYGPNASHAGVSYYFSSYGPPTQTISGVAAFRR